jgi:hypothetical protein
MKKNFLVIGGVFVLVLLLAGAAFVGGRLLNGQGLPGFTSSGGPMIALGRGGGGRQNVRLDIQPAQELPQQEADVQGVLDHRQNDSIFVGTGEVRMMANKDQSGKVTTSSSHNGPTIEVVVTTRTTVYRDVTMQQFDGQLPSGKIQQVLEEGSLDEIGQSSMITAWGRRTGERIIADILVYTPPGIMIKR